MPRNNSVIDVDLFVKHLDDGDLEPRVAELLEFQPYVSAFALTTYRRQYTFDG